MTSKDTLDTFISFNDDYEPLVTLTYRYYSGCEATMYERNGDPGHPAEDEEVEILSIKKRETGEEIPVESLDKALYDGLVIEILEYEASKDDY